MIYGYFRAIGKNNDLNEKIKILQDEGCEEIIYDLSSAYTQKRENLKILLEGLQENDVVIIENLISLSKNVLDLGNIIEILIKKNAKLKIRNLGYISNGVEDRIITDTIKAVIKFKKEEILETARIGKEIASDKKDFKNGRPKKYTKRQIENALSLLTINGGKLSYNEVSQLTKISKSTLIREAKKIR